MRDDHAFDSPTAQANCRDEDHGVGLPLNGVPPLSFAINGRFLSQPTTGVQRVAREFTRTLDKLVLEHPELFDVTLIVGADARMDDLPLRGIKLKTVGKARRAIWEQVLLPRAAGDMPLLCLGNTAPVPMLLSGKRVAVMIHDLSYRIYPEAYGFWYRSAHTAMLPFLLRHARPIFTVSHSERLMLSAMLESRLREIVVTPNGGWRDDLVDGSAFAEDRLSGPILYVGSFSQRKNFHGAVACAVELALRDGRRSVFIGAGADFLSSTRIEIPEAARPLITFRGQVEGLEELAQIYRDAACLLFPSFYEASPMPPAEAFALGCPVIASNIPSLRERCGNAALYCEPDDIADMISCIDRVTQDQSLAGHLVRMGYLRAAKFSWRQQVESVLQALQESFVPRSPQAIRRS